VKVLNAGGKRLMASHIIDWYINNDSRVCDFEEVLYTRTNLRSLCMSLYEQDIQSRRRTISFARQRVGPFQPQSLSHDKKDPAIRVCQIETLHTSETTLL
jgi:hypothetical protein